MQIQQNPKHPAIADKFNLRWPEITDVSPSLGAGSRLAFRWSDRVGGDP